MLRELHIYIKTLGFFALFVLSSQSSAQAIQRKVLTPTDSTGVVLLATDHLILISSLEVINNIGVVVPFSFHPEINSLQLGDINYSPGDTVYVSYLYLESVTNLQTSFDTSKLDLDDYHDDVVYNLDEIQNKKNNLLDNKDLVYNGSFSRGFSVGNSQSLVLNSNFDMQMSGDIGNGIKVLAAIADDNIPIQPEGNTQVLQEFDKVFIEVSKDATRVLAGDFELRRPDSYFMNFQKKLKGLNVGHTEVVKKFGSVKSTANIASSRGKFARQNLPTKEGNQGPYKLEGNNKERFIIVLSNQEKVYFNGELLRRGQEYDYVIDYNAAEITFSPNRLIARETRVIVEFEYTDLNYFRSLYHLQNDIKGKSFNVNLNFYSEQDSKNSTSQIDLDSTDIATLMSSGDSRKLSFRSGIRPVNEENVNLVAVTYELWPNPAFPAEPNSHFLRYSTDKDKTLYTSAFSEVGAGRGSYEIDNGVGVNGRVYKYVGYGKGKYDTVVELVPPEQKQMATLGGSIDLGKSTQIRSEIGMSNFDINRFSGIDDQNNFGLAGFIEFENLAAIQDSGKLNLINKVKFEKTQYDFNPLNPYRTAEFTRDWNVDSLARKGETVLQIETRINAKKYLSLGYRFSNYSILSTYKGFRHQILFNLDKNGWKASGDLGLTSGKSILKNSQFLRPNFNISKSFQRFDKFTMGVSVESENNVSFFESRDSILDKGYAFTYSKYYLASNPQRPFKLSLSYNKRYDDFATRGELTRSIDINEYEVNSAWQINAANQLRISVKNRDYDVLRTDLVKGETSKNTLLASIDHLLQDDEEFIQMNTNYQLSSGQEPKTEFIFQRVENNLGDYVYIGNAADTVKKVVDFRYDPGNPYASYIRVNLPNNEFIKTNNLTFNYGLRLDPSRIYGSDSSGFKKLLSRFYNTTSVRVLNKSMDANEERQINPFGQQDITSLVSASTNFLNTIYFNRGNPDFDIILTSRNQSMKNNQINGYEARKTQEDELKVRKKIFRNTDWILNSALGLKTYDAELFADRDHRIQYYNIGTEISFRPSTAFRIKTSYQNSHRNQLINLNEEANTNNFALELNQRSSNKSSLDMRLSYVDIAYAGDPNTPLEYDILDGLKDGGNVLWNALYTRRLNGVLDLSVSYEGRKTGSVKAIHVGRAQVKATF